MKSTFKFMLGVAVFVGLVDCDLATNTALFNNACTVNVVRARFD